uniref:DUF642 domain-containing protein n=1 Tax=viral metagenome TaxID=1070528 RepID=A0A6C0E6C6_9ZZZZ
MQVSQSLSDGLSFLGIFNNNKEPFTNSTSNSTDTKQLESEYQKTLREYDALVDTITRDTKDYLFRISDKNPYLNKYVSFTDGKLGYVTNQGIFKAVKKLPYQTQSVSLGIKWNDSYLTNRLIPTNPTLYIGTDMVEGKSVGNEGNTIFVDKMIQNTGSTYLGCYADNKNMKFIGGEPSVISSIVNGSFSKPSLKYNSYRKVNSISLVPGWNFQDSAYLLNNSKDWGYPMPYPNGDQCVSLQKAGTISQMIKLDPGNNTISFIACGRNCCDGSKRGNIINVLLNDVVIYTFEPPIDKWTTYTTNFNVSKPGNNAIKFQGTWTKGDRSTAIQRVSLSEAAVSIGSYTNDDCKQAAIDGGFRFYGLQQVDYKTNKGYCSLSNDKITSTRGGTSRIVSGAVPLWSTKTSGVGNKATLTPTGTMSIFDSNGKVIFNTPAQKTSNYIGCYNDKRSRAMETYDNGLHKYNNDTCKQIAMDKNYLYYGLQNSTSGQNSQCFLSNDLSQLKKYGKASSCKKISDGLYGGNGWSNAVYTLDQTNQYYLILLDDGNMNIYLGESPEDKQHRIWSSNTNTTMRNPNPLYTAEKSTHGRNWISSGSSLAVGDFIGSTDGSIYLIMQADGNLVLYTSTTDINCKQLSTGQYGGGVGANALYEMSQVGQIQHMGKIANVDQNSGLHNYAANNIINTNEYTKYKGFDSVGSDITSKSTTLDTCQQICNDNKECVGYAFTSINNMCYPKRAIGPKSKNENSELYVRSKRPIKVPTGITDTIAKVDSVTYHKYAVGNEVDYTASTIATNLQKQQLAQLRTKLDLLSNQISANTISDVKTAKKTNAEIQTNQFSEKATTTTKTPNTTTSKKEGFVPNNNLDYILDDSKINLTMQNYVFLSWSLLALGTILVSTRINRI